jgi:hypothetical protein
LFAGWDELHNDLYPGSRKPFVKIEINGGVGLAPTLYAPPKSILTRIGKIIDRNWNEIPNQIPHVTLDKYVIIPNHIQGILTIKSGNKEDTAYERVTARVTTPLSHVVSEVERLGSIIGAFKSRYVVENLKYIWENGLDKIEKV